MHTNNSIPGMNNPANPKKRFEPMLLLVIGIPALTVLAGIYTMYLAFNGPENLTPAKPEPTFKGVPLR